MELAGRSELFEHTVRANLVIGSAARTGSSRRFKIASSAGPGGLSRWRWRQSITRRIKGAPIGSARERGVEISEVETCVVERGRVGWYCQYGCKVFSNRAFSLTHEQHDASDPEHGPISLRRTVE